ncbi:MAG: hypothetical protein AB7R89_28310 [Dehalococcoidia bacterium]
MAKHHYDSVYAYAQTPEGRAQIERDRIDAETRADRRMACILPGCHARIPVISDGFCGPEHTAAWHALPEFCRSARGAQLLARRDDLAFTALLMAREPDAMAAFNAVYAEVYGDPVERLAQTARASREGAA